jgi:hypothetical protein
MRPEVSMHPGELLLRRALAQEPVGAEVDEHLEACERCRARLKALEEEQRKFEAAIPFERFAAGVERAVRTPGEPKKAEPPARWLMALAAGLVLMAGAGLFFRGDPRHLNRVKGTSGIELFIAAPTGVQREGSPDPLLPEVLGRGERVRVGYHDLSEHYLEVVSVDDNGEVSLYPAQGTGLQVSGGHGYLPQSLEFYGTGLERMIVVASKNPIDLDELKRATRARWEEAHGNVSQMGPLELPGEQEQFHRTFKKP